MTASSVPAAFLALAETLAEAAGPILRRYYRTQISVDDKADASPVTIADRDAEAAMRAIINREQPEHGIFGEEFGEERSDAEWVWVLDPVDGTKAFITGKPSFGTLIALLHNGAPVLGVIDQPILRERWLGAAGHPTTLNGDTVRVRPCDALAKAALYATGPEMFTGADETAWDRLRKAAKLPRYGADCYAYALLASGFVDLVVEAQLKPYDYCSMVPIIEGAGGIITDWRGQPLGLHSDGRVVAAGDLRAHAQALAVLGA
ncbi:MAG: histidinol-phosphatase [Rhodospirillales bacterium]|nr:histidinol-phosphatase [Rhodospirillales bacterium]